MFYPRGLDRDSNKLHWDLDPDLHYNVCGSKKQSVLWSQNYLFSASAPTPLFQYFGYCSSSGSSSSPILPLINWKKFGSTTLKLYY